MEHKFWGKVEEDWAGYSSDKKFNSIYFTEEDIEIFLGDEFDEEGEFIEAPPTLTQLTEYERIFTDFISQLDTLIIEIKEKAFQYYLKRYAHYYENSEKSGESVLEIDNAEKHFEYCKEVNYLRISDTGILRILIRYGLDTEHGMEIKVRDSQIIEISGIPEGI